MSYSYYGRMDYKHIAIKHNLSSWLLKDFKTRMLEEFRHILKLELDAFKKDLLIKLQPPKPKEPVSPVKPKFDKKVKECPNTEST
jgi:hypothetical protein